MHVCWDYARTLKCSEGELKPKKGALFSTNKTIHADFLGRWHSLVFGAATDEVNNCLL